jgi:hypothetical protein
MKKVFLFFTLLLVIAANTYAQETNKTLVKTLDPKGTSVIDLNFKNKGIETDIWDEGTIRIELEITANFPEAVVAQLINAGRYTLSSDIVDGALVVSAKNLEKAVTVGGKDLEDDIKVYAKTPGYYVMEDGKMKKQLDPNVIAGVLDRSGTTQEAKTIIQKLSEIKENVSVTYRFVYKTDDAVSDEGAATKKEHGIAPSASRKTTEGKNGAANKGTEALPNLEQTQQLYGRILIKGEPLEME